ncbi:MAG TPA: hypothetical protein VF698_13240, partial [Thermoanaerobaculia bacterium]
NVVVTLTNQTNDILSATIATPTEGNPLGSATKTILPSTSVQLAAAEWNNYFQGSITITDASSGATVATLQLSVSQPLGGFEGLWPVVSGSASPGYALSPPICNQAAVQGGLKDGYPGAAQVSIFAT